jgi:hypothetical protein
VYTEGKCVLTHFDASLQLPVFSPPMSSSAANVPTMPDDAECINPTISSRMGSITYDQEENCYNLEWESRDDFNKWLTHEQAVIGIKIRLFKTWHSKNKSLYSTCKTFHCTCNGTGGKKNYVKKMTHERKIDSKWIEGNCPCYVQIKTYPHTKTILGKYNHDHSNPTSKDNLKYIWIQVSMQELIEAWVHYRVTDQEIVSDPFLDLD